MCEVSVKWTRKTADRSRWKISVEAYYRLKLNAKL
jgi:hypothetical protein